MESKKIYNPFKEYHPEARNELAKPGICAKPFYDTIPLAHAAEVLAKEIHKRVGVTYKDIPLTENQYGLGMTSNTAIYFTSWGELSEGQKQFYIDRAMEELKK
jgi:hypothetical protein